MLINLLAYLLQRLQSVMNAAYRTIVGLSRSAHVSAILADLHSLKVHQIEAGRHYLSLRARRHTTSLHSGHSYEASTTIICSLDVRPSRLTTDAPEELT